MGVLSEQSESKRPVLSEQSESKRSRLSSKAWPAIFVAIVGASVLLTARRACHVPSAENLDAAAGWVRQQFVDGDLILIEPRHLSGPRERLGDLPLWEPRSLIADDVAGFSRLHLVQLDVIGYDHRFADPLAVIGTVTANASFGDITITTYTLGDAHVLFDLREQLETVSVLATYADGRAQRCERWERDRFSCPRDPAWSYVGRVTHDIDGQPRDCVWLHPLKTGSVLRVVLPPLLIDRDAELRAAFGFTLESAKRVQAPVDVRLLVGDTQLMQQSFPPGEGWYPVTVALPRGHAPLVLELSTTNNGASHFCGTLRVIEP